ncbi:MAG: class I SAM-dependent methyltransferase [Pseudomonadota bacterium]
MSLKDVRQNPNPRLARSRRRRRTTGTVEPGTAFAASWERVHARQARAIEQGARMPEPPGPQSDLVRGLRTLLRDRQIRSILDIGCGDMGWWPHVLGDADIRFYGVDISMPLIRANANRFRQRKEWTFHAADARTQEFPTVDLIVCRHVLNHLWSVDAVAVRRNITRNAQLVALTHDPTLRSNKGDGMRNALAPDAPRATTFTALNMRRPPFMPMPTVAFVPDEFDQQLAFFPGRTLG